MERAERYVDAAAMLCRAARRQDVVSTIVFLHAESGPPVLNVDNVPGVTDAFRGGPGIGELVWKLNPVFIELRARLGIIGSESIGLDEALEAGRRHGYTGPAIKPFVIPLLGAAGWFGTVVHGNPERLPIELERDLAMRATQLSVWCTERGIGRVPPVAGPSDLPTRRYRIAQLAANGLTNAEIAQTLDISINTVKSRLKQVFAQLCVDNRTELATVMRRLAPMREVPLGVSRMDDVHVTRVEHPIGYSAERERSATS